MELLHPRWAGIDISKRDGKVCVRIAGSGRRRAAETVTTWSSMTNQVLALRDHLTRERVTCVVLEAASDYWKPFYYLLEDASFEVMLVNPRHVKTSPVAKMSPMLPGWHSSAPTAWCGPRSCHPSRSAICGI